jgi:hypothetical protein
LKVFLIKFQVKCQSKLKVSDTVEAEKFLRNSKVSKRTPRKTLKRRRREKKGEKGRKREKK